MDGSERLVIKNGVSSDEVILVGELDVVTSSRLDDRLLTVEPEHGVVLDLDGITFIDSSALRVLIEHHHRLADGGGRLELVNVSAPARRLLEISGLDDRLVVDD